jgi:transmembrane sensor
MTERNLLQDDAARWVVRLHSDQVTREEEAQFDAWLKVDPAHAEAYAEHAANWQAVGGLSANPLAREILRRGPAAKAPRSRWTRRSALAAGLGGAVAASLAVVAAPMLLAGGRSYRTIAGEQRRIALEDGSFITLNTSSRLRVHLGESERRIVLELGQAYFQVAKDPNRPFRVFVGKDEVRALGTAFEVRREGEAAKVTLEEGVVAVYSGAASVEKPAVILRPGQQADLRGAAKVAIAEVDTRRTEAWRYGRMILDDVPLAEAVADINRYGGQPITLADASVGTVRISGVFHTDRPDAFVAAVTAAFPVRLAGGQSATYVLAVDPDRG